MPKLLLQTHEYNSPPRSSSAVCGGRSRCGDGQVVCATEMRLGQNLPTARVGASSDAQSTLTDPSLSLTKSCEVNRFENAPGSRSAHGSVTCNVSSIVKRPSGIAKGKATAASMWGRGSLTTETA